MEWIDWKAVAVLIAVLLFYAGLVALVALGLSLFR